VAQAWEYKTLAFNVSSKSFGVGVNTTLYEDGKEQPGSATPLTRANEIGAEGWELVSVAVNPSPTTTQLIYWFKRPK